jgi:capsular polysaccharide biosynthesis protein
MKSFLQTIRRIGARATPPAAEADARDAGPVDGGGGAARRHGAVQGPANRSQLDLVTDVLACPFEQRGTTARHTGGLVARDGTLVPHSGYIRRNRELIGPPERPDWASADVVTEEALFGGYVMDHYGHFLLDTLARLWAALDHAELPLVWLRGTGFSGTQSAILDLVGVSNRHLFVTQPTRFERMRVPSPGFTIGGGFSARQRDFLGVFRPRGGPSGERIWLSRSRLAAAQSRIVEERDIEAALAAAGWRIYHPQEHPILEQLETLATAAEIAGFIGSAFHTLILIRDVEAKVTLFGEARSRNQQYQRIAEMKGFDQRIIVAGEAAGDGKRFWDITVDVALVCEALRIPRPR